MKKIIKRLQAAGLKDVLIIGDVMLDEYIFGPVMRISPEAPVPVLSEETREWSLGGAANVALNCKHIGSNVNLVGIIGENDMSGKHILDILVENNISTEGIIKSPTRRTTNKKRVIAKNHQLIRIDLEDKFSLSEYEHSEVIGRINKMITPDSVVLVSDYAKGLIDEQIMQAIIQKANSCNCMVLIDPKGPDFSKYKGATYMKPNFKEFEEIVDFLGLPRTHTVTQNARQICRILSLHGLIVTMGEKGILFVSSSEEVFIPSIKREVFDLTGAGDTVIAFLAVGLHKALSIKEALMIANKAASVAISHLKTYAVSLNELIDDYELETQQYFENRDLLRARLSFLKKSGKRIVFTNGCFDILHSGHIHILKEAKKCGDILVVALNSDDSIKRIKGDTRPLKPLKERANVMAALEPVDFVTVFDEDTPLEVIKCLEPDVLVKGVDYKPEEVVGYNEVKQYGGEVVIVGWKNENSTTSLVNKLSDKRNLV